MAHPSVKGNLTDDIHASVAELQRDHGKVGFWALKEVAAASELLHFCLGIKEERKWSTTEKEQGRVLERKNTWRGYCVSS